MTEKTSNYLTYVAKGTWEAGFRTPEDFIDASQVDPEEWIITKGKPNTWPTTGFDRETGEPWSVINYQQKFEMVRRSPVALEPHIQPVSIRVHKGYIPRPGPRHFKTAVFISDLHVGFTRDVHAGVITPFHDRKALHVALQVCNALQPDLIVFGGDVLDLPDWSDRFVRSPDMYFLTQPAIVELTWWLGQFRYNCRRSEIKMIEGNHDERMNRAVEKHINQAYQLRPADEMHLPPALAVPRLLSLHKLDIEWVGGYPDAHVWINDTTKVSHGDKVRGVPGATVGKVVQEETVTHIHGHIHRHEVASRQIFERGGQRTIRAISPGCMCHVDGRVPAKKGENNWQQGFAVLRYNDRKTLGATVVSIEDGSAYFEGSMYKGENVNRQIEDQTGWNPETGFRNK